MILPMIFHLIILLCLAHGEDYNLRGEAGQAYSLEINVGTPKQKLNVIVDTGSTTLAIAAYPRQETDTYFHVENSSTFIKSEKELLAIYSQGSWTGYLAADFITIPSLPLVPETRFDFAIIQESQMFFMNGSDWQGLMGLAYSPVGAQEEDSIVGSWLDYLEKKHFSFGLKLCGADVKNNNTTHYGTFVVIDDTINNYKKNDIKQFQTPILRKLWYEVGVLDVHVLKPDYKHYGNGSGIMSVTITHPKEDNCALLNAEKSIVDSGTTNIRLPDAVFKQVVNEMQHTAAGELIPDAFWTHGEAVCWNELPEWYHMPWIGIDLLTSLENRTYFTLLLSPLNYMRIVSIHKNEDNKTQSMFCYKLGLEASGKDTVLGYTAMEGIELLFNRSGGWIGWENGFCGPTADGISPFVGPFKAEFDLASVCNLNKFKPEMDTSIKLAQWSLLAISIIAIGVLLYLLLPCLKFLYTKRRPRSLSDSQVALVDQKQI